MMTTLNAERDALLARVEIMDAQMRRKRINLGTPTAPRWGFARSVCLAGPPSQYGAAHLGLLGDFTDLADRHLRNLYPAETADGFGDELSDHYVEISLLQAAGRPPGWLACVGMAGALSFQNASLGRLLSRLHLQCGHAKFGWRVRLRNDPQRYLVLSTSDDGKQLTLAGLPNPVPPARVELLAPGTDEATFEAYAAL
jgi:hypothetical protein